MTRVNSGKCQTIIFSCCKKSVKIGTLSGKSREKVRKFHCWWPVGTLHTARESTFFIEIQRQGKFLPPMRLRSRKMWKSNVKNVFHIISHVGPSVWSHGENNRCDKPAICFVWNKHMIKHAVTDLELLEPLWVSLAPFAMQWWLCC